jgi:hypothetical protein
MILHPDAIAQNRSSGKGATGIDREDADLLTLSSVGGRQLINERALSGAGVPSDPDDNCTSDDRFKLLERRHSIGLLILQQGDQTGDRADVTGNHPFGQREGILDITSCSQVGTK